MSPSPPSAPRSRREEIAKDLEKLDDAIVTEERTQRELAALETGDDRPKPAPPKLTH